jgi:hypothetical protein
VFFIKTQEKIHALKDKDIKLISAASSKVQSLKSSMVDISEKKIEKSPNNEKKLFHPENISLDTRNAKQIKSDNIDSPITLILTSTVGMADQESPVGEANTSERNFLSINNLAYSEFCTLTSEQQEK